jgi:cation:H+ antiporter
VTDEELRDVHPGRQGLGVGLAIGVTIPGILLRTYHPDVPHPIEALLFGLAIIGAAFVLSWAAEAAQLDISAGLAIAVLAFSRRVTQERAHARSRSPT